MTAKELKMTVASGDLLIVEGTKPIARLIRMMTGQSASHVALVIRVQGAAWVFEVSFPQGFRALPLDEWLRRWDKDGRLYFGEAPVSIQSRPVEVQRAATSWQPRPYNTLGAIATWFAQVFNLDLPISGICSTYVQHVWEHAGYKFIETPDPGDFIHYCDSIARIRT